MNKTYAEMTTKELKVYRDEMAYQGARVNIHGPTECRNYRQNARTARKVLENRGE